MRRPPLFRPLFDARTYASLLFVAAGAPVAAVALGLLIAGWTATAVLAITPLVVPVLVAFRAATGLLARADAALAQTLLGVETHPRALSGGNWFWGRGRAVLTDRGFWRQQAYLVLRMTVGFGLAVGQVSLLAAALGSTVFPAWYRWSNLRFGAWQVDTLPRSLVLVPIGLAGLIAAAWLARLLGAVWARLVRFLLGRDEGQALPPDQARLARRRALVLHAGVFLTFGLFFTLVWALTSHGYFWPEWPLLPLAFVLYLHWVVEWIGDGRRWPSAPRDLLIHLSVSIGFGAFFTTIWALTTRAYFWPVWPILVTAALLALHALVALAPARRRLARRVGVLESTRSGAVIGQEAELRRIERDLHDGAQARLVALGMNLGMAEQKLASDPDAAQQLVSEARAGIGEALKELRDLARGIHPPVLSDRGLAAALDTLADRSALPVDVSVSLERRPPSPVETAAYFVAAEAVTNAAKHSGARRVDIHVALDHGTLAVEIADDGCGGANESGSGLEGLRRRVEALDGKLIVTSPAGGPTVVRAELPCAS